MTKPKKLSVLLTLHKSLEVRMWRCRLGGQQRDSNLTYCVSPWETHTKTDAVCICQPGYDLRCWASSQQMVGEIKSVTQTVTMELRNTVKGGGFTCGSSWVCVCSFVPLYSFCTFWKIAGPCTQTKPNRSHSAPLTSTTYNIPILLNMSWLLNFFSNIMEQLLRWQQTPTGIQKENRKD